MRWLWTNWIDYNLQWTTPSDFLTVFRSISCVRMCQDLATAGFDSILVPIRHIRQNTICLRQKKLLMGPKKIFTLVLFRTQDYLSWFFSAYRMPCFHSIRKYFQWQKKLIYLLDAIVPFRNEKSCIIIWQLHRKP